MSGSSHFGSGVKFATALCRGPFELTKVWVTEAAALGAMAVPGARSHTSRQTAGRTTWCARVATVGSTSTEHRMTDSFAEGVACPSRHQVQSQSPMPDWRSSAGPGVASSSMPTSQRVSPCSRKILKRDSWRRCLKRPGAIMCLQLLGILLLLIENLSGILLRWLKKLDKESATCTSDVEHLWTRQLRSSRLFTGDTQDKWQTTGYFVYFKFPVSSCLRKEGRHNWNRTNDNTDFIVQGRCHDKTLDKLGQRLTQVSHVSKLYLFELYAEGYLFSCCCG